MLNHLLLMAILTVNLSHTEKPAYLIYNNEGELVTYNELLSAASDHSLIFFGELHNNPLAHWLQLELVRDLAADSAQTLAIGFEMFETDQQILLDEYVNGLITTTTFEREARLWNNYKTDYKPIVEYGKANGILLVATNIPRRYASLVYSSGLESLENLTEEAKMWIAPLPVEVDLSLPGYKDIMEAAQGHGGENLPKSQAIKDATMAHFTLKNFPEGGRFVHLNGRYHSDNFEGIVWYIQQQQPDLQILTITTIEAENPLEVNESSLIGANYTIVVPSRMTKTY
jgi:uncharacterized iron-regulated protein